MTDTIFISGLLLHARHGVMDHESKVGQRFTIDLTLLLDLPDASRSDQRSDIVSHSDVVGVTIAAFKSTNYKLVECAAGAVADTILSAFPRVHTVSVTIHKPHAPIAAIFADVGVLLTRSRHPSIPAP